VGLFGDIFSGLGGAVGSIIGAANNKKAIKKASAAQIAAQQAAIDEQRREYDQTRSDYSSFLGAGTDAVEQIRRLLGLGDSNTGQMVNGVSLTADQQQQGALDQLRSSPLFTSQYDTGLDAILQSASATGGLRGGNTQNSLAQFGSNLFAQVLQQQLGNLGGLVGAGTGAAGGISTAGSNMANNISNSLVAQGNSRAGSILGQQAVGNNLANQLQSILMNAVGGGLKG